MKKSSTESEIFDLHEVAVIIGVEDYTVKNWTFGKPFSVEPSVRIGSRTFYDIYDVLTLAVANEMRELKVGFDLLKIVIPLFRDKLEKESRKPKQNYGSFDWIIIKLGKGNPNIELHQTVIGRNVEFYSYRDDKAVLLINFAKVVAFVKNSIRNLEALREEKQRNKENKEG
jgi:hypothetical protein